MVFMQSSHLFFHSILYKKWNCEEYAGDSTFRLPDLPMTSLVWFKKSGRYVGVSRSMLYKSSKSHFCRSLPQLQLLQDYQVSERPRTWHLLDFAWFIGLFPVGHWCGRNPWQRGKWCLFTVEIFRELRGQGIGGYETSSRNGGGTANDSNQSLFPLIIWVCRNARSFIVEIYERRLRSTCLFNVSVSQS